MAKKASVKVADFSNVKERGNFNPKRVAEGDYAATVTKVEDAEVKKGDNKGAFQYLFTIKLQKFSQPSYPYYCQLTENQLWKLRNLAVAAGLNVPKSRMKFDPNKIMGKKIGVTMEDDEYEGKEKSSIAAIFPLSELADGGEDMAEDNSDNFDEESAPQAVSDDVDDSDEGSSKKKGKKDKGKKKKAEPEPEPESEPKKKKKKGKKSKNELEELNIEDV